MRAYFWNVSASLQTIDLAERSPSYFSHLIQKIGSLKHSCLGWIIEYVILALI
jgi:hypothetical protein